MEEPAKAVEEAARCLHCGVCFECEECRELYKVGIINSEENIIRIEPDRVKIEWVSASEGRKFAQIVDKLAAEPLNRSYETP